jgi:ABC-2 type transport system ATP-binding protein
MEPGVTKRRIPELLELVGLTGRGEDRVETFSSGMQQRLHLARALLHDPELIFLDEPTVGIDPVGAREIRNTIRRLISFGKTIFLTTHYMAEAEDLCDRIAIINKGSIVAMDSPSALKKRIGGETLFEIEMRGEDFASMQENIKALDENVTIRVVDIDTIKKISIYSSNPEIILPWLIPFINLKQNMTLEIRNQSLEDVYVSIIKGDQK